MTSQKTNNLPKAGEVRYYIDKLGEAYVLEKIRILDVSIAEGASVPTIVAIDRGRKFRAAIEMYPHKTPEAAWRAFIRDNKESIKYAKAKMIEIREHICEMEKNILSARAELKTP